MGLKLTILLASLVVHHVGALVLGVAFLFRGRWGLGALTAAIAAVPAAAFVILGSRDNGSRSAVILIGSWLVLHAAVLVAGVVLLVRNQRKSGAVATVIPVLAVLELAVFFSMPSRLEFAQQRQTQLMLRRIEGRIREYVESNHERPKDIAPLFRSRPSDAWGTPLQYDAAPEQETWILRSAGPDRQFDTPDDVTVTSPDLHAPD